MRSATSEAQHVVMDTHDLTLLVAEKRASREADADAHRMSKDAEHHAPREPRLRYERQRRNPTVRRRTLAEG
jgi:hypothetical protein